MDRQLNLYYYSYQYCEFVTGYLSITNDFITSFLGGYSPVSEQIGLGFPIWNRPPSTMIVFSNIWQRQYSKLRITIQFVLRFHWSHQSLLNLKQSCRMDLHLFVNIPKAEIIHTRYNIYYQLQRFSKQVGKGGGQQAKRFQILSNTIDIVIKVGLRLRLINIRQ